MDARTFLRTTDLAERERVAASAGTTVAYLKQLAGGHSRPSPRLAKRLEIASGGRMTRQDLLPEFFDVVAPAADDEAA